MTVGKVKGGGAEGSTFFGRRSLRLEVEAAPGSEEVEGIKGRVSADKGVGVGCEAEEEEEVETPKTLHDEGVTSPCCNCHLGETNLFCLTSQQARTEEPKLLLRR